ncbi:MAG: malate dehydrogenase [Candidatus Omnitrophota bacterium]
MKNSKVAVIGAGNVGASVAMRLLEAGSCDVALIDVIDGIAKGKAEDLMDAASVISHSGEIIGSTDFELMEGASIVVITAGFPRKPGMTREELLSKNASIVSDVTEKIAKYSPKSVIINVTNPLDAMTFTAYNVSKFKAQNVFGMAGLLDSSRMNLIISRHIKKPLKEIDSMVLGTHGETMVCALSQSKVSGKPLTQVLSAEQQKQVVEKTKARGAEIVSYLKTGSAFYGPSACAAEMVNAVLKDKKEIICASCLLQGEYGISNVYLGVPAVIGKNGIEKIVELELTREELSDLRKAAESVKISIEQLQ